MMRGRFGRAARLLLGGLLAAACNGADVIAAGRAEVTGPPDAGLDCDLSARLARHNLPSGIGNVYTPECEWPLTQTDSVDNLRWLFDIGVRSDSKARMCAIDPFHVWQEPPPPLPAQRLVFCPGSCKLVQDWLTCTLRDDPCAHHDEEDAGAGSFSFCPQ
jgi:hypothetical protein